jgi:hypothetical protein
MLGREHTYELLIHEQHLDTFGHVKNTAYLQILEEARWDLITRNGYGLEEVHRRRIGPVVLEARLRSAASCATASGSRFEAGSIRTRARSAASSSTSSTTPTISAVKLSSPSASSTWRRASWSRRRPSGSRRWVCSPRTWR